MDAERWAKIDRLLDQAMEHPPEARAQFLSVACADDDELRREVESLLDADSASFLSIPALDLAARRLVNEGQSSLIGKQLGAYQVISVLGFGGMGEDGALLLETPAGPRRLVSGELLGRRA